MLFLFDGSWSSWMSCSWCFKRFYARNIFFQWFFRFKLLWMYIVYLVMFTIVFVELRSFKPWFTRKNHSAGTLIAAVGPKMFSTGQIWLYWARGFRSSPFIHIYQIVWYHDADTFFVAVHHSTCWILLKFDYEKKGTKKLAKEVVYFPCPLFNKTHKKHIGDFRSWILHIYIVK